MKKLKIGCLYKPIVNDFVLIGKFNMSLKAAFFVLSRCKYDLYNSENYYNVLTSEGLGVYLFLDTYPLTKLT